MTTRHVRTLILKGASTQIPDYKGLIPFDLISNFNTDDQTEIFAQDLGDVLIGATHEHDCKFI